MTLKYVTIILKYATKRLIFTLKHAVKRIIQGLLLLICYKCDK